MAATHQFPRSTDSPQVGPDGATVIDRIADNAEAVRNRTVIEVSSVGGTADALTKTLTPSLSGFALPAGQILCVTPASNNTTTTPDLDVGSTDGALTFKTRSGGAVAADDLVAGEPRLWQFDGTDLVALSKLPSQDAASVGVPDVILKDIKAAGAASGTFTAGAWRTRVLTDEVRDANNDCSLASNQFTLSEGDWYIEADAPGYVVNGHQLRLRNTTAGTTLIVGTSENINNQYSGNTRSFVKGTFTVTAAQALELQHYCHTTKSTDGFGAANNFGESAVFAQVALWKIS